MVFISNGKNYMFWADSGHLQVLKTFLLKEFYIICLNRMVMLRSHHFTCFVKSNWVDVYWVDAFVGSWAEFKGIFTHRYLDSHESSSLVCVPTVYTFLRILIQCYIY